MTQTTATLLASDILTQLGQDFTIPAVDLTDPKFAVPAAETSEFGDDNSPERVDISSLTDGTVNGDGAFDKLMSSTKAHLKEQYDRGTITGDQYSKAYIELTTAALSSGVQMILGQEQSYWQAKLIQMQGRQAEIQAYTALVGLEIAKAELAAKTAQAKLIDAQYVQTLVQTAREHANYDLTVKQIEMADVQKLGAEKENEINAYRLANLLPKELEQATAQITLIGSQTVSVDKEVEINTFRLTTVLPKEVEQLAGQIVFTGSQKLSVDKEIEVADYRLDNLMPQELATATQQVQVLFAQELLVKEQSEAQRGQTSDFRTDGVTPILGNMGKQKSLYTQQIDSYQKDAQQKVGKMYLDGWITQKTLDEGLEAPDQLTNAKVSSVLAAVRLSNGLGS